MKSESRTSPASPSALKAWILSARPKTLIAGLSPVAIATAIASNYAPLSWSIVLLCFLFSFSIQVGANWANDYFDFKNGADTEERKGPARAVQSGWIQPAAMKNAFLFAFGLAALVSLPLLLRIGIFLTPLMLLCIVCAILYTGGKRPLGYLGLGELLVFFFYGPVAVCGTTLALLLKIPEEAWLLSFGPGLFSIALLVVNNLRDQESDRKANKKTLTVRFGKGFGKAEYAVAILFPLLLLMMQGIQTALIVLFILLPLALRPLKSVFKESGDWSGELMQTARLFFIYTLIFCLTHAHL